jgi:threonine dehydrogenase-like Zn-dependent dehydrogenase
LHLGRRRERYSRRAEGGGKTRAVGRERVEVRRLDDGIAVTTQCVEPVIVGDHVYGANEPGIAGAAYGFADMGPWPGGQAEYLRVPWGDFQCLRLPDSRTGRRSRGARAP